MEGADKVQIGTYDSLAFPYVAFSWFVGLCCWGVMVIVVPPPLADATDGQIYGLEEQVGWKIARALVQKRKPCHAFPSHAHE